MIKKSFTIRVLLVSFLFLALPLLIYAFIFFQKMYSDVICNAQEDLRVETQDRALFLLSVKPVGNIFLKELACLLDLKKKLEDPHQENLNALLNTTIPERGEYDIYIMKMEREGIYRILASTTQSAVNTYFVSYELLNKAIEDAEGTFIRFAYSEKEKRYTPYIYSAELINSEKDKILGMIMAAANIESQIMALVEEGMGQKNNRFAVLNMDGIVFAATDRNLRGNYFTYLSDKRKKEIVSSGQITRQQLAPAPLEVLKGGSGPFFEFMFEGKAQIGYQVGIPGEISLLSYAPKSIFFSQALRHFLLLYIIYALILVIGGAVTFWFSVWISRPLRQLARLMENVREGNLNARFHEEPLGFEINLLGKLFNHTLENLLENIQNAEDERVKKETYQMELSIARSVQQSLLPDKPPQICGVECAGAHLPSGDVTGDFYDFLVKKGKDGEEAVIVTVADVAGKGFSSCLHAQALRGLLRTSASLHDDIVQILKLANDTQVLEAGKNGLAMSGFYAIVKSRTKIMHYCYLGQSPAFIIRNGIAIPLVSKKLTAGYFIESLQLLVFDIVLFCIEGLTHAKNSENEPYGEGRLLSFIESKKWQSAKELVDCIISELRQFTGQTAQDEEIIVVAVRIGS